MGGPAHHVSLLSGRRFDTERYETLLVHGEVGAGERSLAELADREGARTVYLPQLGPSLHPLRDPAAFAGLRRIAHEFDPEIVHTHTAKAGFLGRSVALSLRPRPVIVHTFHGHVLSGYFGAAKTRVFTALERSLGKRSDALIGVSQATVDELVALGVAPASKFRAVSLGLDLERFSSPEPGDGERFREEVGTGEGEVLLTFVGRLAPIKRVPSLLRAFSLARAAGAQVRLAIVGDGEQRAELEALADQLGIAADVFFAGYRSELPPIAAASDLAVLSSANEGTPVWLIEAAAAGVPAIATNVGGVGDVVTAESGRLVPSGDSDALGREIVELARDSQLRSRMGVAARQHVTTRYGIERLIADIDALYGELLEARS